jgi:hypothetical protein
VDAQLRDSPDAHLGVVAHSGNFTDRFRKAQTMLNEKSDLSRVLPAD